MKKTGLKKILALVAAISISVTAFAGCSVIEYSEEKDLGQVIIELKAKPATYKVPYMMDYLDPDGNPVYEVDEDPSSATFGSTTRDIVQTVMYDHDGNPIYQPKRDNGSIVYVTYTEGASEASVGETTNKSQAVKTSDSGDYWINPETGKEYELLGFSGTGTNLVARWRSLHEVNTIIYGKAKATGEAVYSNSNCADFLPEVEYRAGDTSLHSFDVYSYVPKTDEFVTSADRYYKQEVMNQFSKNGKNYLAEGNVDINAVFDRIVKEMYSDLIYRRETEIAIKEGKLDYGVTERNIVKKSIYTTVDNSLQSIYASIAAKHDRSTPETAGSSESAPTYSQKEKEGKDPRYAKDFKVWDISQEPERWPDNDTSADRNSLERAGFREFVNGLVDNIKTTYSMTEEQRKTYTDEIRSMQEEIKNAENIQKVYKKLYTYEVIHFIYGAPMESSIKSSLLQNYIGKNGFSADYMSAYRSLLEKQQTSYAKDASKYGTDATGGEETILYFADGDVFWVKHILLPFSDEQTSSLTEYKENHTDEQVEAFRQQLVNSMVVYKHIDGENDESDPLSLDKAYANIKAVMDSAYGDEYSALRAFDDLIYDYNTDPGIFDNEMGYAVTLKSEEDGGTAEKYMIEFARESRELVKAYKKGMSLYEYKKEREAASGGKYAMTGFENRYVSQLTNPVKIGSISQPVVTDYGVHILMLNFVPVAGQIRTPNEFLTAAKITTVKEAIYEDVSSTVKNNMVNSWKNSKTNEYADYVMYDTVGNTNGSDVTIAVFKNRFKATLDEYEKSFTAQIKAEREQKEEEEKAEKDK